MRETHIPTTEEVFYTVWMNGVLQERERNLYTLKTMHEDLLDKAQIYNQLGQEREMFACKLAARYVLGAIENIKEAK